MLVLAHRVDRLVEIGAEVELVMDDVRLRQEVLHGLAVGTPDVHRHGLDSRPLRGVELLQKLPRLFFLATFHQIPTPGHCRGR
jgi:hypothetical protein